MNHCWQLKVDLKEKVPEHLNYWLFEVQRLGAELKSVLPDIGLQKLAQFDGVMTDDEHVLLKTDDCRCHIRLVKHHCEAQTVVLARTIIPAKTYKCYRHVFDHLGDQSMGERFLFRAPVIKRSPFYVKQFSPSVLYERFPGQKFYCDHKTWARASLFCLASSCYLLIEEFFLQMPVLNNGLIPKKNEACL